MTLDVTRKCHALRLGDVAVALRAENWGTAVSRDAESICATRRYWRDRDMGHSENIPKFGCHAQMSRSDVTLRMEGLQAESTLAPIDVRHVASIYVGPGNWGRLPYFGFL